MFVTVWLGIFELSSRKLTAASTGHEYPVLRRKNENYLLITSDSLPPLAAMEDMKYKNTIMDIHPGDELFLYTDGVPDAKSPDGERFGLDKMLETLNANKDRPAKEQLDKLKENIDSLGMSNARIEATNNKIKLVICKAYGFRNTQNMIDMVYLVCSNLRIPLPNRKPIPRL